MRNAIHRPVERALEFIACVSLFSKLLDGASSSSVT
jgi:hypothetical protein